MSLAGNLMGDQQQAGRDIAKGYQDAQRYMDPFYQGGVDSYNKYRGVLDTMGGQLDQYGNPAEWMWGQINQNPADYYQTLMKGYDQTPQAKYEQEQMMKASQQGAAASGLLGGGQFFKDLQNNTADITRRDQDRYFNNMLNSNNQQMNYLGDYRGVQNQYLNGMNGMANMGQQAAGQQGQYAIGKGNANAMASSATNPWADLAGRAGGTTLSYLSQ